MARSFEAVVGAVIKTIPPGPENSELVLALEKVIAESGFQAPESPAPWQRLCEQLQLFLGEPQLPWHHHIADLVAGRTAL